MTIDNKDATIELTPEFAQWQDVLNVLDSAQQSGQVDLLLKAILTPDEREALVARLNILHELMEGRYSQRQISQMLKVGVATITRGSTELKKSTDEQKEALKSLFSEAKNKKASGLK